MFWIRVAVGRRTLRSGKDFGLTDAKDLSVWQVDQPTRLTCPAWMGVHVIVVLAA